MKICFSAVIVFLCFFCQAAELTLWDNGKTEYVIVIGDKNGDFDSFAAKELKEHLDKSSGLSFKTLNAASPDLNQYKKRIFVGDSDSVRTILDAEVIKNLKNQQSLVIAKGDDIILVGGGERGTTYAVYDFLEDEIGCRWFEPTPDGTCIPKYSKKSASGKTISRKPAYSGFRGIHTMSGYPNEFSVPFVYRNRGNLGGRIDGRNIPGMTAEFKGRDMGHGFYLYMPPDDKNKNYYPWKEPKTYFAEHPEYYSIDKNGKRTKDGQLCFANMEMRKEFTRRIIERASLFDYKGIFTIGANDWPGSLCYCPECQKLEAKYGCIGGPLYDYILELCAYLKQNYPEVIISTLAYRKAQSEAPPKNIPRMPDNWICDFAPIDDSETQPLDGPQNQGTLKNLQDWRKIANNISYWFYICIPQPYGVYKRIQCDLQIANQNGVQNMALCGNGSVEIFELQQYLFMKLMQNPDMDVKKTIEEYTDFHYGAAAPLMREYIEELETLWGKSNAFIAWDSRPTAIPYATVEKLLQWEKHYDKMLELTKDSPEHNRSLRFARIGIDSFLISKLAGKPNTIDLNPIIKRSLDSLSEMVKMQRITKGDANIYRTILEDGELYSKLKDNSLPPELKITNPEKVQRLLVKGNFEDPDSSAGSVVRTLLDNSTGVVVEKDKGIPYGYYDRQGKIEGMQGKIEFKDIVAGKYKLYYLGRTTISNDSIIWIGSWLHAYSIGRFSQVGNEKLKYDIYARLKFSGPSFGSTDSDKDAVHKDQLFIVEVNE